jgi:hypothetical protein
MSLAFNSANPGLLLATFKRKIDQKHVVTWSYDKDGDFTHETDQWRHKAWLRSEIQAGLLLLHIVRPNNSNVSREVYAIYHGRFIEAMLAHCDTLFSHASASALATSSDQIAA